MQTEFRKESETDLLIHGRRYERKDDTQPWREVMGESRPNGGQGGGCSIPKNGPWFEGSPTELLDRCGITCTDAKRAIDLTNLFDGDLAGFYYVAAASPEGSEEAIIWILGGLAAHINTLNQERGATGVKLGWKDFPRILPADYLRAFCEFKIANKFPSMFAKEIFAELLKADRYFDISPKWKCDNYWCIVEDGAINDVGDMTWAEYEAHIDAGRRPEHWKSSPRIIRRTGVYQMNQIIIDPRFKAVDEDEIDGLIDQVLAENPKEVEAARANPRAVNALIGKIMKASKGKASPQTVQAKLKEKFPS